MPKKTNDMPRMRKIAVGKFGQKLIFNRDSNECKRSNTNGNVGAYLFYKLLFETNPYDMFVVIGDNDLNTFDVNPFGNVIDGTQYTLDELLMMDIDFGIMNIGLLNENNSEDFLMSYINNSGIKWLLVADDPRCLDTKAKDFVNLPRKIVSQFEGKTNFCGKEYEVEYVEIERANCYLKKYDEISNERVNDFVVIANDAGKYDRIKKVKLFTKGIECVKIYGRVSDKVKNDNDKFKGEVDYETINKIMRETKTTFLVPIKENWVTSKYVEVLINGVLPIFHKDYATNLLAYPFTDKNIFDIASTPSELKKLVEFYSKNEKARKDKVEFLRKYLLDFYRSGFPLSYKLMLICEKM